MNYQPALNFEPQPSQVFQVTRDEGVYQNIHGMPFKTAAEFENYYYMQGDPKMASVWAIVDELDTALEVAARLDE